MAKIKDGILGGFTGTIGPVVGIRNQDGSYYIRSRQSVINNPKTPAQQTVRKGFGLCASLFKILEPFAEQGLQQVNGKKPRGAFISLNSRSAIGGAYPNLFLDYRFLKVAEGFLMPATNPEAEWNADGNLKITWTDNSGDGSARASDRVMILVINTTRNSIEYTLKGNTRAAAQDVIPVLPENRDDEFHAYLAFISANGTMISNSVYVPV